MQSDPTFFSDTGWLYHPIWILQLIVIIMGQGAFGVVLLITLRRLRHDGAGSLKRWSQATWGSFLVAGGGYSALSTLPIPWWLCLLLNTSLFCVWVIRTARWAAQE